MNDSPNSVQSSIGSPSFQGLLWTNWLTAINDNIFRWFVIGFGKNAFPVEQHTWIATLGLALFVAPYLLLASPAGWLADRFSKRNVIIGCKIAEIVVMALGVTAVWVGSFNFLLVTVFLMGAQSALFAPAKVGTIPELLDEKTISIGNGLFNLATLSATIIGMFLGAVISDATVGGTTNIYIAGITLIGIAVIGTGLSFFVNTLPAANKNKPFPYSIIGETVRDVVELAAMGRLFRVALGISFFWTVAGIAQIYIDQLADEGGSLFESERTPLLICVTLGIGIGSVIAGYISGGRIELKLVNWGALGISLFAMGMVFAPDYFMLQNAAWWKLAFVGGMLTGIGMSAGFFDVPLASYLQQMSPIERRGSILSATNFMIFSGMLVGSLIFSNVFRAPTEYGAKENLPSDYFLTETTDQQIQDQVNSLAKKYAATVAKANSQDKDAAPIEPLVLDFDSSVRRPLITELVWNDYIRQRDEAEKQAKLSPEKEGKFKIDTDKYSELFPDNEDHRQVKLILRQGSVQPWLNARQIFFVVGLMTLPVFLYATVRVQALKEPEEPEQKKTKLETKPEPKNNKE